MAKYTFGEIAINQMNNRRKLEEEQKQFNEKMAEETRQANLLTAFRDSQLAETKRHNLAMEGIRETPKPLELVNQMSSAEAQKLGYSGEVRPNLFVPVKGVKDEQGNFNPTEFGRPYDNIEGGSGSGSDIKPDDWDTLYGDLTKGYNVVKNSITYGSKKLLGESTPTVTITGSGKETDTQSGIKYKESKKADYQKAFFNKIGKAGYRPIVSQFRKDLDDYMKENANANVEDAIDFIRDDLKDTYSGKVNPKVLDNISLYFKLSKL